MKQLNFRVDEKLVEQASEYIDGVHYRSVGHILNVALAEWVARQEYPIDSRDPMFSGPAAEYNLKALLSEQSEHAKGLLRESGEDEAKEALVAAARQLLQDMLVQNMVAVALKTLEARATKPSEAKTATKAKQPTGRRRKASGS